MRYLFFVVLMCWGCFPDGFSQTVDTLKHGKFLYFDINESTISETNAELLDQLIDWDKEIWEISITGYTDHLGSAAYNKALSERRSANVRQYLINKGIDSKKIIICEGRGIHPDSKPAKADGEPKYRMVEVVYPLETVSEVWIEEEETEVYTADVITDTPVVDNTPVVVLTELSGENLKEGNNIVLKNISFRPGTSEFMEDSKPTLKELKKVMKNNPELKIEIQGHICCYASGDAYMPEERGYLSTLRAKAVYDYLIQEGIDRKRMTYTGYGANRKLVWDERTEENQQMNRRVEIKVLENN